MHLVAIINGMLRAMYFPARWKEADVVFILKPGKQNQLTSNYRPISLLSCLGKVAERVVWKRLNDEVEENNIIQDEQFGFRKKHATTHQLNRVVEHIIGGFNKGMKTGGVFLDVAKAFDRVWHTGLLFKLQRAKVSTALCRILASFLEGRKFRAKYGNNTYSEMRRLDCGVPQGSVLSPILYAIFVSDMPKPKDVELALYADDTAILSSSRQVEVIGKRLQAALNEIQNWFERWRIGVNPEKSVAVIFSKKKKMPESKLSMFNTVIPWGTEAKYLGVTLDKKLTLGLHITATATKARKAMGAVSCMVNRRSKLATSTKLMLYKQMIRPVLTYGAPAWVQAAPHLLHKLQVVQNIFLRRAVGAPWFVNNATIHRDLKMGPLMDNIKDQAFRFFAKAAEHQNALVRQATDYDATTTKTYKRPKETVVRDPP